MNDHLQLGIVEVLYILQWYVPAQEVGREGWSKKIVVKYIL